MAAGNSGHDGRVRIIGVGRAARRRLARLADR
jgi:hypothetical protein